MTPLEALTVSVAAPSSSCSRSNVSSRVSASDSIDSRSGKLQWQDTHPNEVRAIDTLVGPGDDEADAEQVGPLAAQSREKPDPYLSPARTHRGHALERRPRRWSFALASAFVFSPG